MNNDSKVVPQKLGESQIQKFFAGKTIFVSDISGFIGISLVEKLLRGCQDIKKIFVLLKLDKNETLEGHMKKLSEEPVFDTLRNSNPNFLAKVVPLSRDLSVPNLALSEENQKKVVEEVDIIYQNSADIVYDEKLPASLKKNYLDTQSSLDLAMNCKHLSAFIYMSTAYSHSYRNDIDEVFYPAPADLKMVQDIIKADTESTVGLNEDVLPTLIGHWPNVFSFSTSTAEDLVREYGRKASFSCAVFRPTIASAAQKEPFPGWCKNTNGPEGAFVAMGLGVIRVAYSKQNAFDIVPVDMCINSILALTWDMVKNQKHNQVSIFNYGSSKVNPVTLDNIYEGLKPRARSEPSAKCFSYPGMCTTRCYPMYLLSHLCFQILTAIVYDAFILLKMKKPGMLCALCKACKVQNLVYFLSKGFLVDVKQMAKVWDRMVPADRELFSCDLRDLNWKKYWPVYWRGIRVYLMEDPMDTIDKAIPLHFKLRNYHFAYLVAFVFTLIYWKYGVILAVARFFFK